MQRRKQLSLGADGAETEERGVHGWGEAHNEVKPVQPFHHEVADSDEVA